MKVLTVLGVRRVLAVLVPMVLMVLGVLVPRAASAQTSSIDPRIVKMIESISEERMQQLLQKLSSFKTRNTCSDPKAPDSIGAARQWIFDELTRTSPKLQVSFDTHQLETIRSCQGAIELRNVMAVLPGKSPRRIYVSGHYDSLNLGTGGQQTSNSGRGGQGAQGAQDAAPGGRGGAPNAPQGTECAAGRRRGQTGPSWPIRSISSRSTRSSRSAISADRRSRSPTRRCLW